MRSGTRLITILVMIGAAIVLVTTVHNALFASSSDEIDSGISVGRSSSSAAVPTPSSLPHEPGDIPERLTIPSIGVDANVQHVGIGKTGHMAVPTNYTDVGWYRYGVAPGEAGSAVMDGHLNNGFDLAGVFVDLNQVKPRDDIYVRTESGEMRHFIVTGVDTVAYTSPDTQTIFDETGPARLTLITCDGAWVANQKTYDHRLIVTAELAK